MDYISRFFTELLELMNEMSPYLLLGFLFAGILHVFFPKDKVQKYLGKKSFGNVVNASLLGIPLPLCSCGVIPTGVSFYKNGASKGSSVSFLISTPQTGVDSILVTYSLLGLPLAIIRPIIALITGVFGGVLTNLTDKSNIDINHASSNDSCAVSYKPKNKVYRMLTYAFGEFLQDIQKWLVIGILLAGVIAVVVPDNFFVDKVDNTILGMLIMLVAAVPLYVCATASVPIAAILMLKGISPGAALVFLMAGPATNIATMTILGKVFGKKALTTYLVSIIGGALFFGAAVDYLLPREWFINGLHAAHDHNHLLPHWLKISSTILLTLLIINGIYQKNKRKLRIFMYKKGIKILKFNPKDMETNTIIVDGMTCNHCKSNVENKLSSLKNVYNVTADISTGEVDIDGQIDVELIKDALEDIGFEFKGLKKDPDKTKPASIIRNKTNIFFTLTLFFTLVFSNVYSQEVKSVDTLQITTSAQCEMCKDRIEETLAFEKGVKSSDLNMETKIVTVIYKISKTDPTKIKKAINKVGYDADDTKADEEAYKKLPPCCKKPWDEDYRKH